MEKTTFRKIFVKIGTLILWGINVLIAGYEIFLARRMVVNVYNRLVVARVLPSTVLEQLSAVAIGNLASLVMGIIAILIVVGGFDYHWSHAGERKSFRLFGWTFLFQLVFLAVFVLV